MFIPHHILRSSYLCNVREHGTAIMWIKFYVKLNKQDRTEHKQKLETKIRTISENVIDYIP